MASETWRKVREDDEHDDLKWELHVRDESQPPGYQETGNYQLDTPSRIG